MFRSAVALAFAISFIPLHAHSQKSADAELARQILVDQALQQVHGMATEILKGGVNAGSGYSQVWIRDMNTFIEVALEASQPARFREALLNFAKFQGPHGDIIDGYVPLNSARVKDAYRTTPLAPDLMSFKNTVEVDEESSFVQAVSKYVNITSDRSILDERIDGKTIRERLAFAMEYVLTQRFDTSHGLVWGATRADWGDVQPESPRGVLLDSQSHRAFCIYDNAMLIVAINNYLDLLGPTAPESAHWRTVRDDLKRNVRKYLWDKKHQKFIPHVYLGGSPFPKDFDENAIFYHGGTATAVEAGLLSHAEIRHSLEHMDADVKAAHAATIGLTLYPPYPDGFFHNPQMTKPYTYQNGGDWTWFGGRMVRQLIEDGFIADAYRELQPMIERVQRTGGFHEWWTPDNQPRGSGDFRGSAGVLGRDIELLQAWAQRHNN